ncbi:MAG: hypothetical protein U1E17_10920 [Geminicoccaceae bacterium]
MRQVRPRTAGRPGGSWRRALRDRSILAGLLLLAGLPAHADTLLASLQGRWADASGFAMTWAPAGDGFALRWTTAEGKSMDATFKPTGRPGVLAGVDDAGWSMFGGREPLNPLVKGTLRWARLTDEAVYVYSLAIDDKGAYLIERYGCRPEGDRLQVAFQLRRSPTQVEERAMTLSRVTP